MHATIKGNEGGGVRGAGGERRPAGAGRDTSPATRQWRVRGSSTTALPSTSARRCADKKSASTPFLASAKCGACWWRYSSTCPCYPRPPRRPATSSPGRWYACPRADCLSLSGPLSQSPALPHSLSPRPLSVCVPLPLPVVLSLRGSERVVPLVNHRLAIVAGALVAAVAARWLRLALGSCHTGLASSRMQVDAAPPAVVSQAAPRGLGMPTTGSAF